MRKHGLIEIQKELEKRLPYRYQWQQKQNDVWDGYTNFIYDTLSWEELLEKMKAVIRKENLDKGKLFDYAANRWFNFWSAVGVEQIFSEMKNIQLAENNKDCEKDFFLSGIPFDHKTSVFPKKFGKDITYALQNNKELISWLYQHQSSEKRYHLKNRLFVVVHAQDGNHWKIKADLMHLKTEIEKYVSNFSSTQLQTLTFASGQTALSDIIWVNK